MPKIPLADHEIALRIARDLPRWRFESKTLRRLYRVNGFRSALLAANAIGHLAEAAWHHPDLSISWGKVEVSLSSHDAGGVTERDLALAQKIEDLMTWKPSGEPLEGTPDDPAHAYILTD